jgi:hypothetical protein
MLVLTKKIIPPRYNRIEPVGLLLRPINPFRNSLISIPGGFGSRHIGSDFTQQMIFTRFGGFSNLLKAFVR